MSTAHDFVRCAMKEGVLKFGEFKTKAGRITPYFWNAGEFKTGDALNQQGRVYAERIAVFEPQVIYGPPYKGISIAAAAAMHLGNVGYCYTRKEAKDHGEGGTLVGMDMAEKRVVMADDVITDGGTKTESAGIIKQYCGNLVGLVVGLDRQERGATSNLSAVQEFHEKFGIRATACATLADIIDVLKEDEHPSLHAVLAYRERWGAN